MLSLLIKYQVHAGEARSDSHRPPPWLPSAQWSSSGVVNNVRLFKHQAKNDYHLQIQVDTEIAVVPLSMHFLNVIRP